MAQEVRVFRIPMAAPRDMSGLAQLIESGSVAAREIIANLAKTEGNGCVNDYVREYVARSLAGEIGRHTGESIDAVEARVAMVMSGGTEGVLSPHCTVFARRDQPVAKPGKRLVIGVAQTADFNPEEIGRMAQIEATAKAVTAAMADAGIVNLADVHFVQVKCPLLTSTKIEAAAARARTVVTHDTYESMGYSRGASGLGVALALGEVRLDQLNDASICSDWSLYSGRASVSAGIELENNVVVVFGNAEGAASDVVIGHAVMQDAIDADAVRAALAGVGIHDKAGLARIVNVFGKAEADPTGRVRGARHTMLNDSDINQTRHARAAVGAVVASCVGNTMVYVSGGAEHQGPAGGGPIAVVARL